LGVPHSDITTGKRRHDAYLAFCKKHKLHPVAALPGLAMKQGYGLEQGGAAHEIQVDAALREGALLPLNRMLDFAATLRA
ncbi:hypothetical protein MJI37_34330, partial [Salmonella enterica subsp. enterica serovar Cerro]|nr:hypothetical protein [Salmonella enterica subsp. enterica serovar Cerro]